MFKVKKFIGIILGASYGLLYRLLCEYNFGNEIFDFSIYSISFLWILPIAIGLIPVLMGQAEVLKSSNKQFFYPVLSVLLFFIISLSSGLEDWLCILLLSLPFTLVAGASGVVFAEIIKRRKNNKLYSIIILPLIFLPIESTFNLKKESFKVSSEIEINASKSLIWDNIVEVKEIGEQEYDSGFFNYIGVPRPIKSELKNINGDQIRIGYFSDELKLYERVLYSEYLAFIDFEIDLQKSTLRDVPTDKHILKSEYFKFEKIGYVLTDSANGNVCLKLNCKYSIESKMNWYANFWAKLILKDFEERLLKALKNKIENAT